MPYRAQLDQIVEKMRANPSFIEPLHHVYQFNLDGEPPFQVRFDRGTIDLLEDCPLDADCTLITSASNFSKMLQNDLNTTMAFMLGSLKVNGRMGLALKLQDVLKQYN